MKISHAFAFLVLVLLGVNFLIGSDEGGNGVVTQFRDEVVQRHAAPEGAPGSGREPMAAAFNAWSLSDDEEPVGDDATTDVEIQDYVSDTETGEEAPVPAPRFVRDETAPSPTLTVSGSRVMAPRTELIEY